ncbi:molybdate ABC transporter substrate-binding protein [Tabrizicola sp.]|uniref:molybdate ABC transporter substrate-binding protein n=1 Tax=Tabrizicola sp. TaxID=2005166 RepID=UPI0027345C79|nr:molybdate ABC transporter substrate-binding protein [Tabrizicola sp.]MDP3197845.1 molybdate ABC transporter substrate-binding protein [Tabrizicola sp.]
MRLAIPVLALVLSAQTALADVTVFAAASLKTALDQIALDWTARTGSRVTLSYGGTPALARQIAEGAPADLFLSASKAWMDDLQDKALIRPETRRDLLGNSLVLVAHGQAAPVTIDASLDLPGLLQGGKLAMALVDAVPAGQYGKEALATLGLWVAAEPSIVQSENVRAALHLVALGEAPLGIVYASDAVAEPSVTVIGSFPAESHTPIVYPAALTLEAGPDAMDFLDHLSGPAAQAVFQANGFLPLQ